MWPGQIASDQFFGHNAYAIYFVHNHLWLIRKNGHHRPSMMVNWWPSVFSHNRVINWTQWPSSDQCEGSLVSIFLVVERYLWAGRFQQRAVGEEIFLIESILSLDLILQHISATKRPGEDQRCLSTQYDGKMI
jgi:hypothetical protein